MLPLQTLPVLGRIDLSIAVIVGLVAALVAIVGIVWFVARRANRRETEDSGTERVTEEDRRRQQGVPLRTHAKSLPIEGKLALGGVVVILLVVAYEVYSVAKTGGPSSLLKNPYVIATLIGVAAGVGGLFYERRRRRKAEGRVTYIIEADAESGGEQHTETIHIDPRDVDQVTIPAGPNTDEETKAGLVAYEYTERRLFGVVRRARRIAEDRRLRDDPNISRPLDDKIGYLIPLGPETEKTGSNEWTVRTKGIKPSTTPHTPYDYKVLPPFSMNRKERERIRTDMQNLRDNLSAAKERIANQSEQIEHLEEQNQRLLTEEFDVVLGYFEKFKRLADGGETVREVLEKAPNSAFGHSARDTNGDGQRSAVPAYGNGERGNQQGGQR